MGFRNRVGGYLQKMAVTIDPLLRPEQSAIRGTFMDQTSYLTMSKEGYKNCSTVYRAVNAIIKRAQDLTIGLFEETEEGEEAMPKADILTFLKRPNHSHSGKSFIEEWLLYLLLGGETYIWANFLETVNRIFEMWNVQPHQVDVIPGELFGSILRFDWTINGVRHPIPPELMLYNRFPDPTDYYAGLSPLRAAGISVDLHNQSNLWDLALLLKGAKPSFHVRVHHQAQIIPTKEQMKEVRDTIREENQGADKVGGVIALRQPGVELVEYGWKPQDMDWLAGIKQADVAIANAYNVPPELVGAKDKTYSNFQEANKAIYMEAVLPLMDMFLDSLSNWPILGLLEAGQILKIVRDKIEALREDQDKLWARLGDSVDRGEITRNESRIAKGFETSTNPMADELTVTQTVMPLEDIDINVGADDLNPNKPFPPAKEEDEGEENENE